MTRQIADILRKKLNGLVFLDKIAGLVQTVERTQPTEIETAFAVTKFPSSADTNIEDCFRKGCYKDLVPNSKNKGILYFENNGIRITGMDKGFYQYQANLRCVVWVNNKLIQGTADCESITPQMITYIRKALEVGYFNDGDFSKIRITATGIIENEYRIFDKYTYPQEALKYIFWPYEAFAIDFSVSFQIHSNCLPEIILNPDICTT